jgi:hypothetical protein
MSLKQWIAAGHVSHPKSSPHLPTQHTMSESTLPATAPEALQPDSSQVEILVALAGSLDDGTALALQEFRLSCPD